MQEVWIGIVKGINKLEDVTVFPRWAFRILNNKCADWLRKRNLQSRLNNQIADRAQSEPDRKRNINERIESLHVALEKLSPNSRALLTLRYHENFDISQIAEVLGTPEGTIKSQLHRTLNQLREIVERYQNG